MDLVGFTLIVDDIVYPDGTTRMGVLGGGGTSAMSLANPHVMLPGTNCNSQAPMQKQARSQT
jgi:hypothetical protein